MMTFAIWVENLSFFAYIRGSGYEYPIILALHLVGLAFFAGLILLTDVRLLGWGLRDIRSRAWSIPCAGRSASGFCGSPRAA